MDKVYLEIHDKKTKKKIATQDVSNYSVKELQQAFHTQAALERCCFIKRFNLQDNTQSTIA